jgi:hypothetical protein
MKEILVMPKNDGKCAKKAADLNAGEAFLVRARPFPLIAPFCDK